MPTGTSSVAFPGAAEPLPKQIAHPRPPHLPFRRISLPAAPTLLHRQSVASVASFDSHPEEEGRRAAFRSPERRRTRLESSRRRDRSVRPDPSRALKRRKIIDELYETEKTYVEGLDLVYSHFLVPIVKSLDTPEPILNRATLTATFSNFIDIWNFHQSFFDALGKSKESIGPLLVSHFPYLSLYNPFITQFSSILTSLNDLTAVPSHPQYNPTFAAFLQEREADPRCGKLKLRDWLLSIVQRCPRYLLLLKDLINNTDPEDPEYSQLTQAHGLVLKITQALNTALHAHAQTLALLALQRSATGLTFQLISPGRTLLKRGMLLQAERNDPPRPREFLLFSDCLVWFASIDGSGNSWDWDWSSMSGWSSAGSDHSSAISVPSRPRLLRSRSKSEAELPSLDSPSNSLTPPSLLRDGSAPSTPTASPSRAHYQRRSHNFATPPSVPSAPPMGKRRSAASSSDEKWTFKGRADLVDLEVTVGSVLEEETRFEVLSPEGSFVVYAASQQEREAWVSSIRQAKSHLLITLNVTNPNSTLTSSASTNHIRRSLQALPFHPSDERLAALNDGGENHKILTPISPKKSKAGKKDKGKVEVRRKVEHWVPPIWIPDGKTNECMRCGKLFGWRRRRHHCRLCGRCVCADCSGRTFFIADASGKVEGSKAARACDACYESVFPIIEDPPVEARQTSSSGQRPDGADTISSLSNFPAWVSMPSMASPKQGAPQVLMAIDLDTTPVSSADARRAEGHDKESKALPPVPSGDHDDHGVQLKERRGGGVVRAKPHAKMRSYNEIVEEFEIRGTHQAASGEEEGQEIDDVLHALAQDVEVPDAHSHLFFTPPTSQGPSPVTSPRRKEDTARRSKRFSLPALALHTTSVTARASMVIEDEADIPKEEDSSVPSTPSRPKRYSIVLSPGHSNSGHAGLSTKEDEAGAKSLAMDKLNVLLQRHVAQS